MTDPDVTGDRRVARVVVDVEPFHLDRPFDYLVGDDLEDPVGVGSRVEVTFNGRRRRGLVVEVTGDTDVPDARLRPLRRTYGPHAWARRDEIEVLRWAADRWGGSLADVVRHALPARTVAVERAAATAGWFPPVTTTRTDRRLDVVDAADPGPWTAYGDGGVGLARAVHDGAGATVWRPLPDADVGGLLADLVLRTVAGGRDAVVVTPDGASRVARHLVEVVTAVLGADAVVDVRGDTSPRRTYRAWLRARCGQARVVVGERGVVFWPVDHLGLAVVLDEANPALKERRSPRHHAREVLLERARRTGAVGLLVTTVPSAATWGLLRDGRLATVLPPRAVERERAPTIHVDDGTTGPRTRLGNRALPALRRAVAAGRYGVVLAARTGEGTALVCAACGYRHRCPTCGSSIAAAGRGRECRTCGWRDRARPCPECRARDVVPLAAGAQRLGAELRRGIEDRAPVVVLEGHDQPVPDPPAVVVMTRGSVMDTPPGPVGAIVLPDLDALSRRPAVDAPEDALRLAMAVTAWGSGEPGVEVVVRTDTPTDPVVQSLVRWDPGGFWRDEGPRRAEVGFPPARHAIAVTVTGDPAAVVAAAAAVTDPTGMLGPVPLPGGESRLLLLVDDRATALAGLAQVRREASKAGQTVRVDVDPVDLS